MKARVYGALFSPPVSPGPWLIAAFAGAFAVLFSPPSLGAEERLLFRSMVLHAVPLALVATGAVRFAAGRYVGVRLAAGDAEPIVPVLATLTLTSGAGAAALAAIAALLLDMPPALGIALTGLAATASMLFVAVTVATATRDHDALLVAFAAGAAVSAGGALGLARSGGTAGAAHGFMLGLLVAFGLLAARALRGPGTGRTLERDVLRAIREEGDLAAAGVLFAVGAFADELIVGWGPLATSLANAHARGSSTIPGAGYTEAMFLAYATAIPALVVFPIWIVGPVREAYRDLFRALEAGATRAVAAERRRLLGKSFRTAIVRLLELEGTVAIIAVAIAPRVVEGLGLDPELTTTFRAGVGVALLHVLLLLQLSALAYLESRRMLVIVPAAFAGMTAIFSAIAGLLGTAQSGLAALAASVASAALAQMALERAVALFEPDLLTRQPIDP